MTDQLSGSEAAKAISNPFGTLIEWLAGLLPEGPARILLYVVAGLCFLAAPIVYKYYLGVLAQGAAPEGSIERRDYDKLRASLAGGNLAARLYAKWLTAFLDWIERFFGDCGLADRTLFPHAFGLKKPAPLWTALAFDRCLLLALFYPIGTILVIWSISGHVGPAEAALHLPPNSPGWQRWLLPTMVGFSGWFGVFLIGRAIGIGGTLVVFSAFPPVRSIVISVFLAGVLLGVSSAVFGGVVTRIFGAGGDNAGFVSGLVAGEVAGSGLTAGLIARAATGAGVSAGFVAFAVATAFAGASASAGGFATGVAGAVTSAFAVLVLGLIATQYQRQAVFFWFFLPAMIMVCLAGAASLSRLEAWSTSGPILLFFGLLTLLNAPFDWASLGLTRALLRRGLELGGWWPYLLALVDAALAGIIIALLALAMTIGVQAFDDLAVHGGGKPTLPLDALFDGIAYNPAAPEYWWTYALLLSSMIPSLVNLTIGGMAFTRGIPWLARLLLQWIPEGQAVPDYRRPLAAIGLTTQMFAGVGLGIAAQAFLVWGLIFHVMPWAGLDLLDMARAVADFNVPRHVWRVFGGTV